MSELWHQVKAPKWEPARTAWLLTCVDLTGLLVGFFVLVFSTKTLDRTSWDAMTGSLQAAFSPKIAVVAVVPDGMPNALVVASGAKSGLGYLDTLLHQRLEGEPMWQDLVAQGKGVGQSEMTYTLPPAALDLDSPTTLAGWRKLAMAVRGWKNPIVVRVNVADGGDMAKGAARAVEFAGILAGGGAVDIAGEVKKSATNSVQLVVKAQ